MMIVKKSWEKKTKTGYPRLRHVYTGWFLLGIVPLYVHRQTFKIN